MIGATIILADNPSVGTVSDFDGNFSLSLDPGTYNIKVSFISFATLSYQGIKIEAGKTTVIDGIMKSDDKLLEEVVIVAKASRNSEIGMITKMKNSTNIVDGLSAQSFRKIGDSDLSGAIKRVTGVTVEGGKYVYVRGLGDRYTKTTLNGMSIPGLDPDVNAVQIDIFPPRKLDIESSTNFEQSVYVMIQCDLPFGRAGDARKDLEQSAFARAVASHNAEDIPLLEVKGDIVQRPDEVLVGAALRLADQRFRQPHGRVEGIHQHVAEHVIAELRLRRADLILLADVFYTDCCCHNNC